MEYVEGEDLRKRIDRGAPIDVGEVIRISRAILDPLRFAHKAGIVHRDLSPTTSSAALPWPEWAYRGFALRGPQPPLVGR